MGAAAWKVDSLDALRNHNVGTSLIDGDTAFDINEYLKTNRRNLLFTKCHPNIDYLGGAKMKYKASGMVAFCSNDDTAEITKMLLSSGFFNAKIILNWVPFRAVAKPSSALVAFVPASKSISLQDYDIKEIKMEEVEEKGIWKLHSFLLGKDTKQQLAILFKDEAAAKIISSFHENAPVLLKCTINNRELYYSGTPSDIAKGVAFDYNFKD